MNNMCLVLFFMFFILAKCFTTVQLCSSVLSIDYVCMQIYANIMVGVSSYLTKSSCVSIIITTIIIITIIINYCYC